MARQPQKLSISLEELRQCERAKCARRREIAAPGMPTRSLFARASALASLALACSLRSQRPPLLRARFDRTPPWPVGSVFEEVFRTPFFHMRRTNTWHFLQQSGQFLRLSGRPPLRYGLGPTASKIVHFVEGNATCWSDACEKKGRLSRANALASLALARSLARLGDDDDLNSDSPKIC